MHHQLKIRMATREDIPTLLKLIKELAEYHKSSDELLATEEELERSLFGEKCYAEVILGFENDSPISYALFCHNFSTLLGKPGLYLVDLYVVSQSRKQGVGRRMLAHLAKIALDRSCSRFEWAVMKENNKARLLYEDIGAKPMEEWVTYRLAGEAIKELANSTELQD